MFLFTIFLCTFAADQTPTPTRLIRNCDEVGLFDDLQNMNPFEETFRRAVESKNDGSLSDADVKSLKPHTIHNEDTLHTPNVMSYFSLTSVNETNETNTPNELERRSLIVRNHSQVAEANAVNANVKLTITIPTDSAPKTTNSNNQTQSQHTKMSPKKSEKARNENSCVKKNTVSIDSMTNNNENSVKSNILLIPQLILQPNLRSVIANTQEVMPNKTMKLIVPTTQAPAQIIPIFRTSTLSENKVIAKTKKLKRLFPKIEKKMSALPMNPIKEKLKEVLLKTKIKNQQIDSKLLPKSKTLTTVIQSTLKTACNPLKPKPLVHLQSKKDQSNEELFERKREAAKRYRIKLKRSQNELNQKNVKLQAENAKLKEELKAARTLLLAHQDCSVSRALNQKLVTIPTIQIVETQLHTNKMRIDAKQPIYYVVQKLNENPTTNIGHTNGT